MELIGKKLIILKFKKDINILFGMVKLNILMLKQLNQEQKKLIHKLVKDLKLKNVQKKKKEIFRTSEAHT